MRKSLSLAEARELLAKDPYVRKVRKDTAKTHAQLMAEAKAEFNMITPTALLSAFAKKTARVKS